MPLTHSVELNAGTVYTETRSLVVERLYADR
jgi:hypothetical protein